MSITLIIVILTSIASFVAFNNEKIKEELLFWPARINNGRQYYRFFSHGLVHADILHLAFNMLALYSFGQFIEQDLFTDPNLFGRQARIFYLLLYVLALVISSIPDYFKYRDIYGYRALGASGAVSAVIFAGIILEPRIPVSFIFLPIPIPGYIFALIYIAFSAYMARRGGDNIGHSAHLYGALFGVVYVALAGKAFANANVLLDFYHSIISH